MDKACRLCRREGKKLFLKGDKCIGPKCPFARRSYAPGMHGQLSGGRVSEYGHQLREKQSAARIYGLREKIFRNYYKKAAKTKGTTDEKLLQLLETRLDNVVFRSGIASSRAQARKMVVHRHVKVNNRIVDIPSYNVSAGEKIDFKDKIKSSDFIKNRVKIIEKYIVPAWLKLDKKNLNIEVLRLPGETDIEVPFDPALIIEYYSR
jgi:small subunit ribosomal protein S4